MRPTPQELNRKPWYRALKVAAALIVIAAFIVPLIVAPEASGYLLVDGTVNALTWAAVLLLVRSIVLYVAYGKREISPEERQARWEWAIWGTASVLLVAAVLTPVILWLINR